MKGSTKSIAALLLLVLLTAAGCSAAPQDAAYRQISMKEAAELMETQEDFILLDVRTEEEFAEQHIPGAICIPNEEIGAEEPPQLPDREQLILVYCRSGNRSKQASQKLAELGYSNVVECGGIQDWTGEIVSSAA